MFLIYFLVLILSILVFCHSLFSLVYICVSFFVYFTVCLIVWLPAAAIAESDCGIVCVTVICSVKCFNSCAGR